MDLGLLQRDVARRIGACVASVWLWESERAVPGLKWVPAIIGFLGYDPTPPARTIGERLVHYRTRLGWTQKRLAEALEIDQTTLGRWGDRSAGPVGKVREESRFADQTLNQRAACDTRACLQNGFWNK